MTNEITDFRSSYVRVLSTGSFRYLWIGQMCSQLAANTLLFVLALKIYQLTGSNTAVSGLFLAYGVPAVVFGMVAGTIVDHIEKRQMLLFCDIARAIIVFSLVFFSQNIATIYLLMFINAVITQFYVPSEAPTIPLIVPKSLIVTANSLFSFTFYSSLAIGTISAGPMLRLFGNSGVFLFISLLFVLASVSVSHLPKDMTEHAKPLYEAFRTSFWHILIHIQKGMQEGLSYIASVPMISDALLLLTGTQIIIAILGTIGPGFADRVLEIDIRDSSIFVIGPVVLGIVTGALWVGQFGKKIPAAKLIRWGIVSAGFMLIAIALTVRLSRVVAIDFLFTKRIIVPVTSLMFFLLGAANSLVDIPANSTLQKEASGDMRGRVYGLLTAAVGGVGILPVVAGGVLADTIGTGKVIFLLGCCVMLYGFYRRGKFA